VFVQSYGTFSVADTYSIAASDNTFATLGNTYTKTELNASLALKDNITAVDAKITTVNNYVDTQITTVNNYVDTQIATVQGSHKNMFINGGTDIWQRGASFTADGYTADMWKVRHIGTGTLSNSSNRIKIAGDWTGVFAPRVYQILEGGLPLGEELTMSALVKNNGSSSQTIEAYSISSAGSGQQAFSTLTILPAEEKVMTWTFTPTVAAGGMMFYLGTGVGVIDLEFTDCKLERGSYSKFEANNIGLDLMLCQRYYQDITVYDAIFVDYNNSLAWGNIPLTTTIAAGATLTFTGTLMLYGSGQNASSTGSATLQTIGTDSVSIYLTAIGYDAYFARGFGFIIKVEL
jgi:hypothetical protein